MAEIIPAILEKEWREIENKINLAKDFSSWVQIDVADGIFTPEKSWNNPFDLKFHLAAAPPSEKSINFEVDLMVKNPEFVIKDWADAGIKRVAVHIESGDGMNKAIKIAKDFGVEIGLALNIDTPNEALDEFMPKIDFVQFMGIAKIGFQGQSFDEKVLYKIKDLRMKHPSAIITIDGGVNIKTIPLLVKAGADRLIAGSAIFSGKRKPFDNWKELKDLTADLRD